MKLTCKHSVILSHLSVNSLESKAILHILTEPYYCLVNLVASSARATGSLMPEVLDSVIWNPHIIAMHYTTLFYFIYYLKFFLHKIPSAYN